MRILGRQGARHVRNRAPCHAGSMAVPARVAAARIHGYALPVVRKRLVENALAAGAVSGRRRPGGVRAAALALALAGLGALALPGAARATDPPFAPPAALGAGRILPAFAAGAYRYELVLEPCKASEREDSPALFRCPFAVRLMEAGRVRDRIELPHRACGLPEPMTIDRFLGADSRARAWTTEADRCEVQVAARAVDRARGVTGC
jgi:hypothetical protein